MLDLSKLDLETIGNALEQQDVDDHRWLIDPGTGEIAFWTSDTGIDGENPVDLDDLDHLVAIDSVPPHAGFQDMADFADGLSDDRTGRRLARALDGRKPFRRFKDELYGSRGDLIELWHTYREARKPRAGPWSGCSTGPR